MPPRSAAHFAKASLRPWHACALAGAISAILLSAGALLAPAAQAQPNGKSAATGTVLGTGEKTGEKVTERQSLVRTSRPLWRELTARQQTALQPLAGHWDALSEAHKRKWLVLSRNYSEMSAADRTTLHSRMSEWAGLSTQQRSQARFNFAEVKQLPVDERKAKWEAYQALSEDEKRQLADRANTRQRGATATARPVPIQKLVPIPANSARGPEHMPRIQLAPPATAAAPLPSQLPVSLTTPAAAAPAVTSDAPSQGPATTLTAPTPQGPTAPVRTPSGPLIEAP